MRTPSEWEKAECKEAEFDELKKVLSEKEREVKAHQILEKGLNARIEFLEDKVLTQKVELEDAEKTIKRLKGDEFTNTIRRNQEGTLMRITSFLNGALINDLEQDKVRERVGDRKLTIDQRLEALMGEMNRVRDEARRSHKEAMDLRNRLEATEISLSACGKSASGGWPSHPSDLPVLLLNRREPRSRWVYPHRQPTSTVRAGTSQGRPGVSKLRPRLAATSRWGVLR